MDSMLLDLTKVSFDPCISASFDVAYIVNKFADTLNRTSASAGHPPPFIQLSDTRCKAALESTYWADLITTYELQRFLNRFHMAMHAQTSTVGSVPDSLVATWENEYEVLKPLLIRFDTGKIKSQ